ncbi:MAG: phosphatidate cytidylyltransferase [Actinobacteria bacterium]|nr:phosphatidate cytidylyltransferase [Actinomycetota bacterium]
MFPFADELFLPAAGRLSLALAGALGLIVTAERHRLRELRHHVLFLRWKTWALTAPLFGAAAMGPKVFAGVFVAALALQGMREYARLTELPRAYRTALYIAGVASAPVALASLTVWRAMPPVLLIAATAAPVMMQDAREGIRHLAYAALGFAYIPWLLTYFILVREHVVGGPGVLLALGTAVAASDVFAFIFGKLFGRRPLAPTLSPNKTLEGVGGNLVGAYLGFGLMSFALPAAMPMWMRWVLPAVVAIGCLWGDLVESLLKRQFGVKDAGDCLPGFGGLLDRIDSLLIVLPIAYTVIVVAG